LSAVRQRLVTRAAARLRRALGFADLQGRLDIVDRRLSTLEAPRYPAGPVYLGDHLALVATRWGAKMVVDTRDSLLAPWLLLDGLWEAHVTGWFQQVVRPGDVLVDIGANVGYFTLLGGQLVGDRGRVVAVEAHPGLVEVLRRNVVINGMHDRVTVWHRAAWSEATRLPFHQRVHYAANSSLGSVGPAGLAALGDTEEKVEVDAVPVDDLLEGLPRVDVLKVDVEGAEVQAFRGLARTLGANRDLTVMFEWSPEQLGQVGDTPAALLELLAGHGLRFRLLEDDLNPIDPARLLELPYGNVVAGR
jgi:FkbM family methyltransferase